MRMLKIISGLVGCALSWNIHATAEPLHIRVLDVGEGQAILLHQQQRGVLIDTGHAGRVAGVVRRMQALDIRSLDYLLLTHLHADHVSGYFRIQEAFGQASVRDNCYPAGNLGVEDIARWVDEALRSNSRRQCVQSGDRIEWGSTDIHILWPPGKPSAGDGLNHTSLVLQVRHQGKTLLIMGDAGHAVEKALLRQGVLSQVDILVVGHHGATDATSEPFLEAVKPTVSVISTNENNLRGYPSSDVVQRLQRHAEKVFTTYQQGELHFVFGD